MGWTKGQKVILSSWQNGGPEQVAEIEFVYPSGIAMVGYECFYPDGTYVGGDGSLCRRKIRVAEQEPQEERKEEMNWEEMKDHIVMKMMPAAAAEKNFKEVVRKKILDLAAVYYLEQNAEGREYLFPITYFMCGNYGITSLMLTEACEKQHPLDIKTFGEIDWLFAIPGFADMWCITNDTDDYGASVIAYPGALEKIARKIGGAFYLLPASIHELFAIREEDCDISPEELNAMIKKINEEEVASEMRLTDHCYYYDLDAKELIDPLKDAREGIR